MTKGWLIYKEQDVFGNEGYINWFIEEAAKQELSLELVLRETIAAGVIDNQPAILREGQPETPDFAIVRTIEPILNLHLETAGVAVFNSYEVSRIANDKALAHHHVQQLGVPMNDTFYLQTSLLKDEPPLAYPFVLKQTGGRGGKEVYWIANDKDWASCRENLPQTSLIAQKTDVQIGKDIRVFVVGKEIVGAVLRESKKDFRANFKLGGHASLIDLSDAKTSYIQRIINRFEFGMVGIDFLIASDGGLLFNEIEDIVGSRTLSATSEINILEKYISLIKSQLKTRQ